MIFEKYSSLENHYQQKVLKQIHDSALAGIQWIAREKIHGSNFSFWFDGTTIRTAKRSGFDPNFCNSEQLITKYEDSIIFLYEMFLREGYISEGQTIAIFGEVFGGSYHGKKLPNAKTVQKGMDYHPDTEFMFFDIKMEDSKLPEEGMKYMSDVFCEHCAVTLHQVFGDKAIKIAPEVGTGTLEEVMKIPNEFPTLVPKHFGLELPDGVTEHTVGEGYVMRPALQDIYINQTRVILKSKNSKFSEKGKGLREIPQDFSIPEEKKEEFQGLLSMATTARLQSVFSKEYSVQDLNWKMLKELSGKLVKDITEDFSKEFEVEEGNIRKHFGDYWVNIHRNLSKATDEVVRNFFKEVL